MASIDDIFNVQRIDENEDTRGDTGHGGMVVSAVKEATDAGNAMLEKGGNAYDAVIAVQLALSVVEGMNTGVTAGGFFISYDSKSKETKLINAQTLAPNSLRPDSLRQKTGAPLPFNELNTRAVTIGVPGIMKGLEYLQDNYAALSLETLIEPAIDLAENGFEVHAMFRRTLELFKHRLNKDSRDKFLCEGAPVKKGARFKQHDLARTLKIIRDRGYKDVYEGEIADAIVKTAQKHGGIITHQDLRNYSIKLDSPLWTAFRGFDVALPPPPSGGGIAVAQQLKMFEALDISKLRPRSAEKYHLTARILQHALADQQEYAGDPEFHKVPVKGLLHPDYIKERSHSVKMNEKAAEAGPGNPWKYQSGTGTADKKSHAAGKESFETTHFTAVDRWGNIAACTSSIERIFGSGIMVPDYGFLLNNDMTDFKDEPGSVNEPNGSKHPSTSKSPAILYHEGKPFLTLGSPGGTAIVSSVAQTIVNIIDFNMGLEDAVREERIYVTPNLDIQWEDGIASKTLAELEQMGYKFNQTFREDSPDTRLGDVQAIMIDQNDNRMLYGFADVPRPGNAKGPNDDKLPSM